MPAKQLKKSGTTPAHRTVREGVRKTARKTARKSRNASKSEHTVTVVQVHSSIGCPERQRRILQSLGLRRPHQRRTLPDVPSVRGMVAALPHLVRIDGPAKGDRSAGRKA